MPRRRSLRDIILPDTWTYETLSSVSKQTGIPVGELLALKADNDPYMAGRDGEREKGEWFAAQLRAWQARFPGHRCHMRGLHYYVASQNPPPLLPELRSGKRKGLARPYINHEDCWKAMQGAATYARYLGLVGLGELEDHRTPAPHLHLSRRAQEAEVRVAGGLWGQVLLPWPRLELSAYVGEQPVVSELWIEKSTMDELLLPLCERYDVTLQTGVGQMGIEPVYQFMLRAQRDGRPHIILYISDHDAQGEGMPVAVARKIQWMVDRMSACPRIQLYPIALTKAQVQSYRFDRSIKGDQCEPTALLPCSRFWPTVTWGADDSGRALLAFIHDVRVVQRLEFEPDAGQVGRGDIFRDRAQGGALASRQPVAVLGANGSMKREDRVLAIKSGQRTQDKTWDSWHQTDRGATSDPGVWLIGQQPGCSECVHMHWSWGGAAKSNVFHKFKGFTDGKPEILDGSKQTTWISVVRYSEGPEYRPSLDELDPWKDGYEKLVNGENLLSSRPVVYWDMDTPRDGTPIKGTTVDGRVFPLGDAAWPQLQPQGQKRDGTPAFPHGGNGSMFFAPARVLAYWPGVPGVSVRGQFYSIEPQWKPKPGSDGSDGVEQVSTRLDPRLPAGWVLPVNVNTCQDPNGTKGPFWISVTTGPNQRLLNPDPSYAALPHGTPYITLHDDALKGAPPKFTPGDVVSRFTCVGRSAGYRAYLVFDSQPTAENVPSLALLGAPDGTQNFQPYSEDSPGPTPLNLPTTPLGGPSSSCPKPPWPLPNGIPDDPTCLSVVNADLDGDGKRDQLLVWSKGHTYGATAYLGDGTHHPLATDVSGDVYPGGSEYPYFPVAVADINGDGRDEVMVNVAVGANQEKVFIFTVTPDGALRVVTDSAGHKAGIYGGGGAGQGSGWGCVVAGGQHLLVQSGYAAFWSQGLAYGWGATYLRLDGATLRPVGWQGGYAPDQSRRSEEIKVHDGQETCQGRTPDVGAPAAEARTPIEAMDRLIAAARRGDQATGSAYLAGYEADEGRMASNGDVWGLLTGAFRADLPRWAGHPPTCGRARVVYGAKTEATCSVVAADRSRLDAVVVQLPANSGAGWVVSSVTKRGGPGG